MCKISQRKRLITLRHTILRWYKEKQKISLLRHQLLQYPTTSLAKKQQKLMTRPIHQTKTKKKLLWQSFKNFPKNKLTTPNKEANSCKLKSTTSSSKQRPTTQLSMKEVLRKWQWSELAYSRLRHLSKTFLESTSERDDV